MNSLACETTQTWRHGKPGHVRLCIWGLISESKAVSEGVCAREVGDWVYGVTRIGAGVRRDAFDKVMKLGCYDVRRELETDCER